MNLGSNPGRQAEQPPRPQVRPLEPCHLEACLALDQSCLKGLWSRSQWVTELADPQRPGLGLWQQCQLRAMACGWLVVDELHVTLVAVAPSQQRQGLGRLVLSALLEQGRLLGAHHATLEVAAGNQAACALYRSAGFAEAGRRRRYYRNGEDALIQWRRLQSDGDGARQGERGGFG